MIRRKLAMLVLGLLVVTASALLPAAAAIDSSATLIVMPARTRMIQLGFQVARVKDVGLVAYNNSPTLAAPLIHVWNGREWIQIGMDEYTAGTFMPSKIAHVFILGDAATLPAPMTVDPAWAGTVHKTADLGVASLLNRFNEVLKFSGLQWRWLAEQNGLKLTDSNVERRRYGRWGKKNADEGFQPEATQPPTGTLTEPPVKDVKEPALSKVPVTPLAVEAPKVPETATAPMPAVEEAKPEVKPVETKPAEAQAVEAKETLPVPNPAEVKSTNTLAPPLSTPIIKDVTAD